MTRRTLTLALIGCLAAAGHARAGLIINLNPDAGLAANPAALAAFQRAAQAWQNVFTDNITVNINAGLSNAFGNPNIIGSTSSTLLQAGYNTIRNAMVADAAPDPHEAIAAFLPTAAQFSAFVKGGTTLNGLIVLTQANANALGFNVHFNGGVDATITFNSNFAFDYDRSNGVDANKVDFETVATHEIGHALGFISAVDFSDGGVTSLPLDPLDLYRFPANGVPTTPAAFTTAPRDVVPGDAAVFGDTTNTFAFSTGVNGGDGRQASHWKDDSLTGKFIGIMDPTLGFGQVENISSADVRALGLIGWDVNYAALAVPEPASVTLLLVGAFGLTGLGRLRRKVA